MRRRCRSPSRWPQAKPPRRIAYTSDYGGRIAVDRETREICERAVRRFEELGCVVEEYAPDLGAIDEAFMVLRAQHFVVDRELQLQTHRDLLKPDIIWNTEKGLAQTPSRIAWAERERAAFYPPLRRDVRDATTSSSRPARRRRRSM